MPSRKRGHGVDQAFSQITLENPSKPLSSTTAMEADVEFTEAVNQYLAPEDKIGPSNSWPNHALDRDSRAIRAYYRAIAVDKHLATDIEKSEQRYHTSRTFFVKELWYQERIASLKDSSGISQQIQDAIDEYAQDSMTASGKVRTKMDFLQMQLLCQLSIMGGRVQQLRVFNAEKLFVLESEERQRVLNRLEACECKMISHNTSYGKNSCRCSECKKEAKMVQAVKLRASDLGSYSGVPFKSRSEKVPLCAALAEYNQLFKAVVKDAHTLNASLRLPAREPVYDSPKNFTFMTLSVPRGWPQDINDAVKELEHILYEIDRERTALLDQRDEVRRLLLIGLRGGEIVLFEKTDMITDYPDCQRYEYTRNSVLAMFVVWRNIEEKIHGYIRKEGIKLSVTLSKAFGLQPSGVPEWRMASWEESFATIKTTANSIDDMLRQCNDSRQKFYAKENEEATAKHGEWWKVLVGKGVKALGP
ncbi:MAG: hypothetical protein M1812_005659 [Candelaria pacifica]|nr:MAG: hypothetical protein M1812_005659 [Candelaria pacifica]